MLKELLLCFGSGCFFRFALVWAMPPIGARAEILKPPEVRADMQPTGQCTPARSILNMLELLWPAHVNTPLWQ